MDVQRHLEVIRFTVLREHAQMRQRAEEAKEQLAAQGRIFDELILSVDAVDLAQDRCRARDEPRFASQPLRLDALPQLQWTLTLDVKEGPSVEFGVSAHAETELQEDLEFLAALMLRVRVPKGTSSSGGGVSWVQ
eukprot:g27375.t1